MSIKPGSGMHLLLLAMRPGPMDTAAIHERFPSNPGLGMLVNAGLIKKCGETTYCITAKGRAACPPRTAIPNMFRDARGRRRQVFDQDQQAGAA